MDIDAGDVAGIIAGFKAGQITERVAKNALRDLGFDDGVVTNLLSLGAGLAVDGLLGSVVDDLFDGLF
jgi:hypothetical protein